MTKKIISATLILIGFFGLIASIFVDLLREGSLDIQAAQILTIGISLITIIIGTIIWQIPTGENYFINLIKILDKAPLSLWGMIGFFASYLIFFIWPMFFGNQARILYFNKYLPDRSPIGSDLLFLVDLIRQWLVENITPFHITLYPPFTYIFFSPLTLINDTDQLYKFFSLATIASFVLSSLLIPLLINKGKDKIFLYTLFTVSLFSYGLQFELERGQFNIIAFLFSIAAIYIYHHHHSFRHYAYILFSIAVQLKIYPAIFIFMLVQNWRDWKRNLLRAVLLGLSNFALLFVMGLQPFQEFINAIIAQLKNLDWAWEGNHSINSFVLYFFQKGGLGLLTSESLESMRKYSGVISDGLLFIFLLILLLALYKTYQDNSPGIDTNLFLTCAIGALIIPISHDYTLPILSAPMTLALSSAANKTYGKNKPIAILLLIVTTAAYVAVIYPFKYKAIFFQNSFPFLFITLVTMGILSRMRTTPEGAT